MSTSPSVPPLGDRIRERAQAWRERIARACTRMGASTDLPELLTRISHYYMSIDRRRGSALRLELDPALAPDLAGPYAVLGDVLCLLLDRAFEVTEDACVALQVDVVGDTPDGQLVHITVADPGDKLDDACPRLEAAARRIASLDGVLHRECAADRGTRVIIEVALTLPRRPPRIDIETLRTTLGGTHALREVIAALDRSLSRDLAELDVLLAQPGIADLQAWLHRVSGALGMAEATDLARMGLTLERHLAEERDASIDAAIRRFGEDAAHALQLLRKHT